MPGSGKSTLGVQLAKMLGMDFIDTDILIKQQQKCCLQDILDNAGYLALRQIEEEVLLSLDYESCVIATGGSAVYSDKAMQHLANNGLIIFLEVPLNELKKRIHNESSRGIARPEGQSFTDVYAERTPLYQQYATITHLNLSMNIQSLIDSMSTEFT